MSQNDSGGDQTEDGELQQSPPDIKSKSDNEISLSEDDDTIDDSLDIKPPQAKSMSSKREKIHGEKRSKKSDKHRDLHQHREKHHHDKHFRSAKEREYYQREKERYYREKHYEQQLNYSEIQYERTHKERKEERSKHESRKHDDKKRETREVRYMGHHRDRHEDERRAEKNLNDLRERLINKREESHRSRRESHRSRKKKNIADSVLEGESGMYVKEIINISGGDDRREKRDDITEEERAEQDLRREKLLEAEREMARLKEQSRMERERRHLERSGKRKTDDLEEHYKKRLRSEDPETVTVSDNSDAELIDKESDKEDAMSVGSEDSRSSRASSHDSRSISRSKSEDEQSEKSSGSEKRSQSSDRSATASPESTQSRRSEEKDMEENAAKNQEEDHAVVEIDEDLPPYYPALQGCRSVEEFQCLNRIEEGTYGVVYRSRDKRTEEIVALKRLKMEKEKEGFPITSLREINTLLKGQHKNIVTVREIVVGSNMDKIFIVMDYVEHDLKSLIETMRHKKKSFTLGEVKCLLRQLLLAVAHLHDNWILHRDLKTSNLLLSHKGILKVGDFGLAREYGSPLKAYTAVVVTLWYRAPELLLCTKEYSTPIDMWSVGCIFAELLLMNAVFPGKSEVDQLNRIFKDLGTPNEKIWTGFNKLPAVQKMKFTDYPRSNLHLKFQMLTDLGMRFLLKFLTYDPEKRITADQALKDDYFNETPLPIDPNMFPTWPAKSELGQKRALAASPKPPSGGGEYKKLRGDEDDYGFRIGAGLENRRGMGFSLKF